MTTTPSELSPAARDYLLTLADDEHMIGARHTAWIGLGPFLEEDLAFCSIAQDELGHAIAVYRIVVEAGAVGVDRDGVDRAVDALALDRAASDFRSSWLAERACDDWASALVRHWLYDRAEALRWENVSRSSIAELAALVPGIQREESFHLRHAEQFLSRVFAAGSPELLEALSELLPLAESLWLAPMGEPEALAEGVAAESFADLATRWRETIIDDLHRWGVDPDALPPSTSDVRQFDRSVRSPGFDQFLSDLNAVRSIDPTAVW